MLITPSDIFSALFLPSFFFTRHDTVDQLGSVKSTLLKSMFEERVPAIHVIQISAATA